MNLFDAVRSGSLLDTTIAIQNGGNVNEFDTSGMLPLFYAMSHSTELLELLLDHGANPNLLDKDNLSCHYYFAKSNPGRAIDLLDFYLANGFDLKSGKSSTVGTMFSQMLAQPNKVLAERLAMLGAFDQVPEERKSIIVDMFPTSQVIKDICASGPVIPNNAAFNLNVWASHILLGKIKMPKEALNALNLYKNSFCIPYVGNVRFFVEEPVKSIRIISEAHNLIRLSVELQHIPVWKAEPFATVEIEVYPSFFSDDNSFSIFCEKVLEALKTNGKI